MNQSRYDKQQEDGRKRYWNPYCLGLAGMMYWMYSSSNIASAAAPEEESKGVDPYARSKNCEPIDDNAVLVVGPASKDLGERVAQYLGRQPARAEFQQFADGESLSWIKEPIKGKHVYILQGTGKPVNDNVMKLFNTVSAAKRGGAATVTCVCPYFGYARQERKHRNRNVGITASDVTQILEFMGVNRIITIDLHALAVQGSVSPKVAFDDYEAAFIAIDYFRKEIPDASDLCIVSPDAGAVKRTKQFHKLYEYHGLKDQIGLALVHKERKKANVVEEVTLIGDVKGKTCIIVDDMTDTSGTLCQVAKDLKAKGAKKVYAYITHGLFSGPAAERIRNSEIEKIVCSDSLVQDESVKERMGGKLVYVSIDLLLAEIIRRTHNNEDTEELFDVPVYKM